MSLSGDSALDGSTDAADTGRGGEGSADHGEGSAGCAGQDGGLGLPPALDTLSEVVFRTDAEGRWTYLNRAWTTLTGFEIGSSLGTGFLDHVHPDELERMVALFMVAVAGGADHRQHQTRYRTRDGSYRWVQIRANVLRDASGEVVGNAGTIVDITDSRRSAEALSEHTVLLELMSQGARLDELPIGVIIYDHALRVRRKSEIVDRMLGMSQQVGDALEELFEVLRPADGEGRQLGGEWGLAAVALRTNQPQLGDLDLNPGSGPSRSLRASVVPFVHQGGTLLALILTEVTDLRRAERQQAGLAGLGQRALSGLDVSTLLGEAVRLVASTLEVPLCDLFECDPLSADQAGVLVARACVGRPAGPASVGPVSIAATSLAGMVLTGEQPVVVNDLASRPEIGIEPWLRTGGVGATVGARIGGSGRAFGVLAAHSTTPRRFTRDEAHFVQSVANVLAAAIERDRSEREVRRLYEETKRGQAWLTATAEITAALLFVAEPQAALGLVASRGREVTGADIGVIAVPTESGDLAVAVAEVAPRLDADPEKLRGFVLGAGATRYADTMRTGRAVRIDDVEQDRGLFAAPVQGLSISTFMILPLVVAGEPLGVLVLGNGPDAAPFAPADLEMAAAFANDAALAIELSRVQRDRERLAVFEDRDRIARDLHDVVIQRLFATGLQLQGLARFVEGQPGVRLVAAVDELDETIEEIRRTIFSLRPPTTGVDLRTEIQRIVAQAEDHLGRTAKIRLEGPIDHGIPESIRPHLLAALREAVANIARHAHADGIGVLIRVTGDDVLVEVHDNGRGPGRAPRAGGLANLRRRALDLGGRMEFGPGKDGTGTTLTWHVPIVQLLPETGAARTGAPPW
ncbi:GAF domain-containing protein [Frankia sp. Cppng1_Ct_nod]|uniref:GAF domain-containing protein n=1 Tax=Frankia sp. Cppng1_Ct_nod TaxID=2897162 RepID=UPI002025A380|nr:GAF domain-containing protein [Frankia sp. Cppng1_Ct_nod]